ncbi:MAG: peptide chain release factor 1 [Planctomycetota bacterium]
MQKMLDEASARHAELESSLADPAVLENPSRYRKVSRECGSLAKLVGVYDQYKKASQELEENRELAREDDPEMAELAAEEIERLEKEVEQLSSDLTERVLVEDENSNRDVIIEIRAGTGGDEAALFTGDLFRMYSKYAERRKWKVELIDASDTDLGGFKEITFSVSGDSVYGELRYEMGGHRVQRVPSTETSGRIHTSAATVAVLTEPEEVELDIKDADLKIDYYRASGPGGQKVNKTDSAVRITHQPTGVVVAIQDETSQHKNKAKALRVLRSRIFERMEKDRLEKEQSTRRGQIGSGDRSQRIRTYNFPQNRLTDHRIGQNFNLERALKEGELGDLFDALRTHDREEQLKELAL